MNPGYNVNIPVNTEYSPIPRILETQLNKWEGGGGICKSFARILECQGRLLCWEKQALLEISSAPVSPSDIAHNSKKIKQKILALAYTGTFWYWQTGTTRILAYIGVFLFWLLGTGTIIYWYILNLVTGLY